MGRRRPGAKGYPTCLSGAHRAQGICRGLSRESGPTSFQTRLFIIQKQLAFLSVLCHPGGGSAGRGKARIGCSLGCRACASVPLHSDAGVVGLGCSGALASKMGAVTAPIRGPHFRF